MHRDAVRQFLLISIVYAVLSGALSVLLHPKGANFILSMIHSSKGHWFNLWTYMPYICLALIAALILTRAVFDRARWADMGVALMGSLLFMWGFSIFKSTMPHIIWFWADPMFAQIDRAVHFGKDPWILTEPLRGLLGTGIVDYLYLKFWAWPAVMGPILLVAFDSERARVARFLLLFPIIWIVLGNIFAMLFMSVGPVYYDRLLGTDEFAGLTAILSTPAEQQSLMGIVREWLWIVNFEDYEGVSSGISAFPSLHVAIACLSALYLWERSKWLAPIGLGYLAFIQLGSVLSGLHYAVDGYFSIVVVVFFWVFLRKSARLSVGKVPCDPTAQSV